MSEKKSTTLASPLLTPVVYAGKQYFTSQYFHAQYVNHSPHGGKYRQHKNFLQSIRALPLYPDYVRLGHIVELTWQATKGSNDVLAEIFSQWKTLFQATGYRTLTLLDAMAQAELSHHLDDAASKQIAHASNTQIVTGQGMMQPTTTTEALLMQTRLLTQTVEQLAAVERRQLVIEARQDEQAAELAAIKDRQPPVNKLRPGAWLRRHSKPHLGPEIMDQLNAACRRRQDPERWRPEGYDWPVSYFTAETIAAAYEEVTRQLSFIHDPGVVYHRRRR